VKLRAHPENANHLMDDVAIIGASSKLRFRRPHENGKYFEIII